MCSVCKEEGFVIIFEMEGKLYCAACVAHKRRKDGEERKRKILDWIKQEKPLPYRKQISA